MSTDTSTSLRLSRIINADRDTVWAAWTEVERARRARGRRYRNRERWVSSPKTRNAAGCQPPTRG